MAVRFTTVLRVFVLAPLIHLCCEANSIAPFTLNLALLGGPSAMQGTTIASGLDFAYGVTALADGSLLFGQSTPSSSVGLLYGTGPATTGSVWLATNLGNGNFAAPQQIVGGLAGVVTSVQTLSNGVIVVDCGAGSAGTRSMGFFTPAGQSIAGLTFAYPALQTGWEHSNGVTLASHNADGSDTLFFIAGSATDSSKTAATISTSGLVNVTLKGDSVYMMTVKGSGNSVQVLNGPQQVLTGVRNPFGLSIDSAGNLVVGDNGIDGPHVVNQQGADTLKMVLKNQLGTQVPDFGFPDNYVDFATGQLVVGNPNAVAPLVAFRPVDDFNGHPQSSEGLAGMAYLAPGSLPFVGLMGGEVVTFHGGFDAGGAANYDNALLYYDFASGTYVPIVDAGEPGVGHLDSVTVTGHTLVIEEMSQTGMVNGLSGLAGGAIYEFDFSSAFATPEPGTWILCVAGLLIGLIVTRLGK